MHKTGYSILSHTTVPISHKLHIRTVQGCNKSIDVLTYLKCTMDFKLVYKITPDVRPLKMFIDINWEGDKETGRSTAGGIIFIYGNPVTWFCQKQGDVSLITSEAEYKT